MLYYPPSETQHVRRVRGLGISLEQRQYASSTINLRLAAVRRLAYEAADCGLLSPDLAAGNAVMKGAMAPAWALVARTREPMPPCLSVAIVPLDAEPPGCSRALPTSHQ